MKENNSAYPENRIKYLLGIDGGGTKTEFLLTDLDKNEVKRVVLGASNPVNAGIENTKRILRQGISLVCGGIDLRSVSVFAGIAGGISGKNRILINEFLSDFGFGAFGNGSDADNALETALKGENGIAVIMGTGIIAFCRADGKLHRTGGWGYLIDKGGSGFCYGSDALNSALNHIDGRGGSAIILSLIEKRLGKPLTDAIPDIYAKGAEYVASFAPVVFEAYGSGDAEAERIIERNTWEAAQIIRAGCGFSGGNTKTVICGGLCRSQDVLKPFLLRHLGSDFPLFFSAEPPVNGAVSLAESIIQDGEKIC